MLGAAFRVGLLLALQDLKQAYRRSILGQAWITLGMLVLIGSIAAVFGLILGVNLQEYLPYVASGIIVYSLISGLMNEGSYGFIAAETMIKQSNVPMIAHHIRVVLRVSFTFLHNLVIFPLVFVITGNLFSINVLLVLPGLILLIVAIGGISLSLGILSARYRDVPPIVQAVMTVGFYVTPVIWSAEQIGNLSLAHTLLGLNPLYHLIQVVRLPLLGTYPTLTNWGLAAAAAIAGAAVGVISLARTKSKIVLWV